LNRILLCSDDSNNNYGNDNDNNNYGNNNNNYGNKKYKRIT